MLSRSVTEGLVFGFDVGLVGEEGGRGGRARIGSGRAGVKTWVHQSRRGLASAYADGFGWGQSAAGEGGAGR